MGLTEGSLEKGNLSWHEEWAEFGDSEVKEGLKKQKEERGVGQWEAPELPSHHTRRPQKEIRDHLEGGVCSWGPRMSG